MNADKYPTPAITGDIIVCRLVKNLLVNQAEEYDLEVLLVKRAKEPYQDCWAIPGGHLDARSDLSIQDCALRELKEETNIEVVAKKDLHFVGYFDELERDPRGRYVTFVWAVKCPKEQHIIAADDAKEFKWFALKEVLAHRFKVAFDHQKILQQFANNEPFTDWVYLGDSMKEAIQRHGR